MNPPVRPPARPTVAPPPRRGAALVAALAALAVVLLVLGAMIEIGLLSRRQLGRELVARQADCLLEAAAERAAARLRAEPGWAGGRETIPASSIVDAGDADVVTEIAPDGAGSLVRIVVDYPAGRPDSVRRERAFAVAAIAPSARSQVSPEVSR